MDDPRAGAGAFLDVLLWRLADMWKRQGTMMGSFLFWTIVIACGSYAAIEAVRKIMAAHRLQRYIPLSLNPTELDDQHEFHRLASKVAKDRGSLR